MGLDKKERNIEQGVNLVIKDKHTLRIPCLVYCMLRGRQDNGRMAKNKRVPSEGKMIARERPPGEKANDLSFFPCPWAATPS